MRPLLHWTGAVLVALSAGVLYDAWRTAPSATISRAIVSAVSAHTSRPTPTHTYGGPVRAAVLLQAVDCTGNLRMLDLLHRSAVRDGVQLSVIWYVGPARDSLAIRPLLPEWTSTVPLRPSSPSLLKELARLGHTSTPLLIVLDQEGRVRFASQSPRSSREFVGLRRIIEGLTWFEDL